MKNGAERSGALFFSALPREQAAEKASALRAPAFSAGCSSSYWSQGTITELDASTKSTGVTALVAGARKYPRSEGNCVVNAGAVSVTSVTTGARKFDPDGLSTAVSVNEIMAATPPK